MSKDKAKEDVTEPKGDVSPDTTDLTHRKSAVIASILSLIIPGVGQMYVSKVGRGVKILLSFLVIAYFLSLMSNFLTGDLGLREVTGGEIPNIVAVFWFVGVAVGFIPALILWFWQIRDAYRQAIHYNEALLKLKRKPSKGEF